jgi:hypothetical protein
MNSRRSSVISPSRKQESCPTGAGVRRIDPGSGVLNHDKIVACALAADADYIVTRDKDLLSLEEHEEIRMITPERFLHLLRQT